jgi:DNA-binding beta-propeller fold protein YncE
MPCSSERIVARAARPGGCHHAWVFTAVTGPRADDDQPNHTSGGAHRATHDPLARWSVKRPRRVARSMRSLALIDSDTGALQRDIAVGVDPGPVAVGPSDVWVGNRADHTITQVDLRTGHVLRGYGLADAAATITADGKYVWIGNSYDGTLSRILVAYQQLSAPFFPDKTITGLLSIVPGKDGLWVGGAGAALLLLDEHSLAVRPTVPVADRVRGVATDDSGTWTIQFRDHEVDRIVGNEARVLTTVSGVPQSIRVGLNSLWVTTTSPSQLIQIDPTTGAQLARQPLDAVPTAITLAGGAAWVAEGQVGRLQRVVPGGRVVATTLDLGYRIGGAGCEWAIALDHHR